MVIDAVDPIQFDLTSMSDIYKVLDSLNMLWMLMCIWMCPHLITAAHTNQAFEREQEFWLTPRQSGNNWWWNVVIEAVDPIQIDLTSMSDIYKVFDNLKGNIQLMSKAGPPKMPSPLSGAGGYE